MPAPAAPPAALPAPRIELREDAAGLALVLNGIPQFHTSEEKAANEYSALSLALSRDARRVLVVGGGTGLSLREVLAYPGVESVTLVEFNPDVLSLGRERLRELNRGAFEDPRVRVVQADATRWVEETPETFDAIVDDTDLFTAPQAASSQPEARARFCRALLGLLNPGGVLSICFPIDEDDETVELVRAALARAGHPPAANLVEGLVRFLLDALGPPVYSLGTYAFFEFIGPHHYLYFSREPLALRREPPAGSRHTAPFLARLLGTSRADLGVPGVRFAQPDDAPALERLARDHPVTPSPAKPFYPAPRLNTLILRPDVVTLVAGTPPAGFLLGHADPGPYLWVEHLAGDRAAVRSLAQASLEASRRLGKTRVRALIAEDRADVLAGLSGAGFSQRGRFAWVEADTPRELPPAPAEGLAIRPAQPGDGRALRELLRTLRLPDDDPLREPEPALALPDAVPVLAGDDFLFLVAERAGRPVGFLKVELDSDGAELGWAVVLPEARGHGIGTSLAIHAARELAARRIPLIYGFVSEKNAHQIAHWEKLGARRGRTFLLCERSLA